MGSQLQTATIEVMNIKQKDFCDEIQIGFCRGGHLNDKENLLCGGNSCLGDAPKKSSILHPKETIDKRAEYLMLHYLFKKVY